MSFWKKASQDEKMAQVSSGIELGMTDKQIAMCLGSKTTTVCHFINKNNLVRKSEAEIFRKKSEGGRKVMRTVNLLGLRSQGYVEVSRVDAFDIFGSLPKKEGIGLDPHPND